MRKTYYEILGVSQNADSITIKNAFRKLAKKYHPDTNPGNVEAEKMFKDVNEAYSVLSDEGKRAKYDRELTVGMNGFAQQKEAGKRRTGETAGKQQAAGNPFMNVNTQFAKFFGFQPK